MKRLTAQLKSVKPKLVKQGIKPKRILLDYVPEATNPMIGVKPGKTPDETLKREIDAVGMAFRNAAKQSTSRMLHEDEGYGAEYAVIVFQEAKQVTAFFEAIGYPDPKDVYIDGVFLAELLKVNIPKSDIVPRKLKAVHNPKLTRLAKPL